MWPNLSSQFLFTASWLGYTNVRVHLYIFGEDNFAKSQQYHIHVYVYTSFNAFKLHVHVATIMDLISHYNQS